jgi:hypothetical protein
VGNNDGPWCCVLIASMWNLDVNKCLGFRVWVVFALGLGFRPCVLICSFCNVATNDVFFQISDVVSLVSIPRRI